MPENLDQDRTVTDPTDANVSESPKNQFVVGMSMIGALLVASGVVGHLGSKEAAPTPASQPAATSTATATEATAPAGETAPASPAEAPAGTVLLPNDALAADFKDIKSQIGELSAQLKGLRGKVDALPEPAPAPDLKPILEKTDVLAKSVAVAVPLVDKVDRFGDRIGEIGKRLESLETEVASLKKGVGTIGAEPPARSNDGAVASSESNELEGATIEAIELFKKGNYKDSLDRLRKLTSADSTDARVWYCAALASGLVSRNWNGGDAVSFVTKGIEREKAGTPTPDKIDAAFSGLTTQTGKDWLNYYRKSAR
jgi:hypothetical protein